MKLFFNLILPFICLFYSSAPAHAFDPKVEELSKKKLPPIEEPKINIETLSNGMTVYYLQDAELPLFKLSTFFETGSVYDAEPERGLAAFFMTAWRSGGSVSMPADKVDETLEFYAAQMSASAGAELSTFEVLCLEKDVKEVLDVYFKILREPSFQKDRVEIIRKGELNAIQRRNEEPMPIAIREFQQTLFGEKSPHAWYSSPETIRSITPDVLKAYYAENIGTNRMWLAATSPLAFDDFLELLNPYVAGWKNKIPAKVFPTKIEKVWEPSTEFIQKEGNQSAIIMGHFAEKRFNPDKYKLILADEILGGATFGSKLGDRIRTELGLAYGVESNFEFSTDFGSFYMATRTKSESTVSAIREMRKILTDMVENKSITESEIELARERILNRLVFEYESPYNIVVSRVRYDYFGYPENYLAEFQKQIEAVDVEQVRDVLAKYFFPDRLKLMVVGDKTKIPNLKSLAGLKDRPLDME